MKKAFIKYNNVETLARGYIGCMEDFDQFDSKGTEEDNAEIDRLLSEINKAKSALYKAILLDIAEDYKFIEEEY